MPIEAERVTFLNEAPQRPDRKYVLYWSQMNRRVDGNHALLYAVELANRLKLPVLVYEGLTCTYKYANDRLHTFILQGVPETARRLKKAGIGYAFYLRKKRSDPNNALYLLAADAAAVVSDDYPAFIARAHNARVPAKLDVAYCVVDSSCVVPMNLIPGRQYGAYTIRPKIMRLLPKYLRHLEALKVNRRFEHQIPRFHTEVTGTNIAALVGECEIDHSVPPSLGFTGGAYYAEKLLTFFLQENLRRYAAARYPQGADVVVHYDPKNPSNAVLDAKVAYAKPLLVVALVFFAAALFFSGMFR